MTSWESTCCVLGGTDVESVTEVDGVGRNCVMYAVHHSQLDTLQILLENGADINLQCHGLLLVVFTISAELF